MSRIDDKQRRLRLAFVCGADPMNVRSWSGTPFHMLNALQEHFDVPVVVREPWLLGFMGLRRILRRLSGGKVDIYWSPFCSGLALSRTVRLIRESRCDVVFTVAITPLCAQLAKDGNAVFTSDATQAAMVDYNPRHSGLLPWLQRSAEEMETRAIRHSLVSFFPSEWARASAIADHGGSPDHVFQIPWGANLLADTITPPEERSSDEWRLLFVGINWAGKGGDIAVGAVQEMRRRGHNVTLDVVGSAPSDPPPSIDGVIFHGFLNKNNPSERQRLNTLFRSAHLFILPTQFDAFPTVIAESASFAVPAIAYRTGGLSSNIRHNETGLLMEPGAGPTAFADAIIALLGDRPRYLGMADAALMFSKTQLNWSAWAMTVHDVLARSHCAETRLP